MKNKILFTLVGITMCYFANAQTWSTYGIGLGYSGDYADGIAVYNGNLFVDGYFVKSGSLPVHGIAQWNGTSWDSVGKGFNGPGFCLAVYNSELYAGGPFDSAGGLRTNGIARWNGTAWSSVGTGLNKVLGYGATALTIYNGDLIVGGEFDTAGGQPVNSIAAWNGSTWSALGSGVKDSSGSIIYAMAVYNGELYVGGFFDTAGGLPANNIAKWNGTTWSAVGAGISEPSSSYPIVYSLCVYEGNLYAAGQFDTAGGVKVNNIAMWNGTAWSDVDGGMTLPGGGWVHGLTNYNDELYAGGFFNRAGGDTANYIAQWDGNKWYPLGTGIGGPVYSVGAYNNALVATGQFNSAASTSCNDIAYWIGGPLSSATICYVTVDTASKYNEILWDKTGIDTNLVDSIRIFSKGFSGYNYIGHVSIHYYTQFVDSNSHPNTTSSTYEICTVDTSGLVSQLTSYDQTILLQANIGVGNVVNLSWNPYYGDSVSYYVILRDSNGTGNWIRIDSVPNNIYAYTDNNPPVSNNVRYVINTVWNLHCVPYTHARHSMSVVTSRSNRKQLAITVTGIPGVNNIPNINIYPNPSKDFLYITLSQPSKVLVSLVDLLGQTIYSDVINNNEKEREINTSTMPNGVYFLKMTMSDGSVQTKKVEILR